MDATFQDTTALSGLRHSSSRSASCGQGEFRWHGVQDDPGTVELRASLPTLPAGERHILVHDADRRRRVGSAVRLRPLAAQTAHPRCPWVTSPVAVSDPNSFEDGALGPLESDAERGMERGEQEPRNALRCICVNDLQDIHIGNRVTPLLHGTSECWTFWCSGRSRRKSRFTESQIVGILKEGEAGVRRVPQQLG